MSDKPDTKWYEIQSLVEHLLKEENEHRMLSIAQQLNNAYLRDMSKDLQKIVEILVESGHLSLHGKGTTIKVEMTN